MRERSMVSVKRRCSALLAVRRSRRRRWQRVRRDAELDAAREQREKARSIH